MYFCMYCVYMCVWNYVCILVRLVCYICMFVHMHTCMHVIFMRIYTHTDTAYTGFCSGRFCLGWFLSVPPSIGKQNVCMHTHNRRTCIHTLMHTFISSICVEAGERLLLCGDLNCADSQGRINDTLTDIFNACGLRQYVKVPTRGDNILDVLAAKLKLEECLSSMYAWFCFNGLAIKPDKSEAILFSLWQRLRAFPLLSSIDLAGTAVPLSDTVKTLSVTLDSKLTFRLHITNLCKSCFYHIRAIHIRSALTKDMSQTIQDCSLVSSRLDYANSLFVGVSDLEVKRLQRIQNSLARVVLCVPLRTCSSVLLHQLHCLPVEFRIRFKLTCLAYKALSTSKPTYLHALLTPYTPPRCLRSSGTRLLAEPRYRTVMGSRAFHFSAPREWNRLPLSLRSTNSLPSFKSGLKLTISSWLSRNWKVNWNSPGG